MFDADPAKQRQIIAELVSRAKEVEERSTANVKLLSGGLTAAANATSQQIAPYKR
jgi:hypothetical protein